MIHPREEPRELPPAPLRENERRELTHAESGDEGLDQQREHRAARAPCIRKETERKNGHERQRHDQRTQRPSESDKVPELFPAMSDHR